MFRVAVACMNTGDWMGCWSCLWRKLCCWSPFTCKDCWIFCRLSLCCGCCCNCCWLTFRSGLGACDGVILFSGCDGGHHVLPWVWLRSGVRTVRSGIHQLWAGELYGELWPVGGGVDTEGIDEITSWRLGALNWFNRWRFNFPSCFKSGTVLSRSMSPFVKKKSLESMLTKQQTI